MRQSFKMQSLFQSPSTFHAGFNSKDVRKCSSVMLYNARSWAIERWCSNLIYELFGQVCLDRYCNLIFQRNGILQCDDSWMRHNHSGHKIAEQPLEMIKKTCIGHCWGWWCSAGLTQISCFLLLMPATDLDRNCWSEPTQGDHEHSDEA